MVWDLGLKFLDLFGVRFRAWGAGYRALRHCGERDIPVHPFAYVSWISVFGMGLELEVFGFQDQPSC